MARCSSSIVRSSGESVFKKIRMRFGEISLYRYLQASLGFAPENLFKWLRPARPRAPSRGSVARTGCFRWSTRSCASCRRRSALPPRCIAFLLDSDRYAIYKPEQASKRKDNPELHDYFLRQAKALGFRVADLDPVFRRAYARDKIKFDYWPFDRHWNAVGHNIAASKAYQLLFSRWAGTAARAKARVAMNAGIRMLLRALSPAGARAPLSILIFHRVHAAPDAMYPDEPDARRFEELMGWVEELVQRDAASRRRRRIAPGHAARARGGDHVRRRVRRQLRRRTADPAQSSGFRPRSSWRPGSSNGGRMWNDTVIEAVRRSRRRNSTCRAAKLGLLSDGLARGEARDDRRDHRRDQVPAAAASATRSSRAIRRRAGEPLPDDLMMTDAQVRVLRDAGMEIGAHTRTHPILREMHARGGRGGNRDRARRSRGRARGVRRALFAYPNGKPGRDYDPSHVDDGAADGIRRRACRRHGAPRGRATISTSCRASRRGREGACRSDCGFAQNLAANRRRARLEHAA